MLDYSSVFHFLGDSVLGENEQMLLKLGFGKVRHSRRGGYTDENEKGYIGYAEFVLPDCPVSLVLSYQTMTGKPPKNIYSVGVGQPRLGDNYPLTERGLEWNTKEHGAAIADPEEDRTRQVIIRAFGEATLLAARHLFACALPGHEMTVPCVETLCVGQKSLAKGLILKTTNYPLLPTIFHYMEENHFTLQPVVRGEPFVFGNNFGQKVILCRDKASDKGMIVEGYHPGAKRPYYVKDIEAYAGAIRSFWKKRLGQPVNMNVLMFD